MDLYNAKDIRLAYLWLAFNKVIVLSGHYQIDLDNIILVCTKYKYEWRGQKNHGVGHNLA
jgi:hypothetical protein